MNIRTRGLRTVATAIAVATTVAAGSAVAMPTISFDLLEARWENGVGASVNYTPGGGGYSNGPVSASWGVSTGLGQSSYVFDARDTPFLEEADQAFYLGQFKHYNMPIQAPFLTSIDLRLRGDLTVTNFSGVDELFSNVQFVFEFKHWETPNSDDPCANGGANGSGINKYGCADRVTIESLPGNEVFTVDGDMITMEIIGFGLGHNPTTIVDEFWTKEKKKNKAKLYAFFSATPGGGSTSMREPAALGLFGLGLIALGAAVRRRKPA